MKLYLSLLIALSLLGSALSGPQNDFIGTEEFEDVTAEEAESDAFHNIGVGDFEDFTAAQFSRDASVAEQPPPAPDSMLGYGADQPDAQDYVDMQGNDQPTPKEGEDKLPQNDLKLLKEQVKRNKTKKPAMAHLEQAGVTHGSYVAIRASNTYLRCPTWSYYCFGSTTYYSGRGADSVFQIYHPYGPGPIRVGDFVGLYSPPNRKWFSMYQGSGHKQSCPGSPRYWWSGFSSYSHWFYCGSEVFRIYARGRGPGQEIRSGDTISLHSSSRGGFLRVSNKCFPHVSTCLQRYWHNQNYAYSVCHGEAFQIYIR